MKYGISHTLRQLYRGQSLLRIQMNVGFSNYELRGKVLDVGGGRNPDYFSYFKKAPGMSLEAIDGSMNGVDFEKDLLPYPDGSIDTVILANVLEHIYNHQFLLGEIKRVLSPNGQLIGFVPFWIGYHPDPYDYFRYTKDALERMLQDTNFSKIEIVTLGGGVIFANFNTVVLSVPRFLRPGFYLWAAFVNSIYLKLRPESKNRNPLGFIFIAS